MTGLTTMIYRNDDALRLLGNRDVGIGPGCPAAAVAFPSQRHTVNLLASNPGRCLEEPCRDFVDRQGRAVDEPDEVTILKHRPILTDDAVAGHPGASTAGP